MQEDSPPNDNQVEIALSESELLGTFLKTEPKPYQRVTMLETVEELANRKDVAIQLPTGTGKTFVYLPIAIAAASKGYRVCILVATNLIMKQIINRYIPYFRTEVSPSQIMGIENYNCLITKEKADYTICTPEQREECLKVYPECEVIYTNSQFGEHNFIITNFHKFLSTQLERGFDLIIIDDSHGFENALDDRFQTRLTYYQIEELYNRHERLEDEISDFVGMFLDLFDEAWGTIPPGKLKRRIPDDIVRDMAKIENFELIQNQLKDLNEIDRNVCYDLLYFVKCCQRSTLHTFYVSKDYYNPDDPRDATVIARKSDTYQERVIKSLFGNSRVLFVSATLGDVKTHANSCTRRDYNGEELVEVPSIYPEVIRDWFKGLYIFETIDFPREGEDPIEKGAEIAAEILRRTSGKSLLLFKNYRDQRKAESILRRKVERRITFIDDSFKSETVQELVEKADVIMATASSRLWEGIDIRGLKLEIIFSLPFIRPPVHLEKSFNFVRRKMLIRLQQGIGRLIREENDSGVCVILDKKLENYIKDKNFFDAYRERIRQTTIEKVCDDVNSALGGV